MPLLYRRLPPGPAPLRVLPLLVLLVLLVLPARPVLPALPVLPGVVVSVQVFVAFP